MQRAHAYHVTEFHNGGNPSRLANNARPRKPICKTFCCLVLCMLHPFQSNFIPLLMVLEARDYGFIGLKLKGLIFHEGGNQRTRGDEYSSAGKGRL
jgi:hypothetical protein